MPFLRVLRDKRGYETTYLIHWYRDGARQRSRILYVFRTPGGVRVGREPLEPEVLRDIEARHPEIAFDWTAVMADRQVVDASPDPRRMRKRRDSADERAPAVEVAGASPPGTRRREAPGAAAPPLPPVPSAIEGATPDEQMAFLALWYPIVRHRIPQRGSDPARREALLALAERLNPAAWTDADQIAAGLQQAAESLERLSHLFSRRRRRPSRASASSRRAESDVSGVESPMVSAVDPPAVSGVEPPVVSGVETSNRADMPPQGDQAPVAVGTGTSSAHE